MLNLNEREAIELKGVSLGLTRGETKTYSHDNDIANGNRAESINAFIEGQLNKGVSASLALEIVKDVSGGYPIQGMTLGLTKEQAQTFKWENGCLFGNIAESAIKYLSDQCSKGIPAPQALGEIKDLNGFQIQAMTLGLARKDLEGHIWDNEILRANHNPSNPNNKRADLTLEYISDRPNDISAQEAMNNIRGLNGEEIENVINAQKLGIRVGLSDIETYVVRLTMDQVLRIINGELYRDVVPEGHKTILEMEQKKQYAIGATSGLMASIGLKGEEELATIITPLLKPIDIINLSRANKETRDSAVTFAKREITKQEEEGKEVPKR